MTAAKLTVAVRMYNVGFGDAFVVTVRKGRQAWRMIVDCGVHTQGQVRSLEESVNAIIDDLRTADPTEPPHVNVLVATHHHADHIAGFALDAWQQVAVDEVWIPFVEDPTDEDARALREAQTSAATRLIGLLDQRTLGLNPDAWPDALATARWFAVNSSRNAKAADRLLGRNGRGFATRPRIRFLPLASASPEEQIIATTIKDVAVHVLGPPRDPAFLKRMNPPAQAGWLALDCDTDLTSRIEEPLFGSTFAMDADECRRDFPELAEEAGRSLQNLDQINDPGLLAAASILERAVNNTSLFFVLDVAGLHLLFPGDAQQGSWDYVLSNPNMLSLVSSVVFYKIAHHGSHNGTPKNYVENILTDGAYAMLPWGLVRRWEESIPKQKLLEALRAHEHIIIRADQPTPIRGRVKVRGNLWTEVTFTTE
jgi:beta-lactamase superfamily II metal-dependent hydrolase